MTIPKRFATIFLTGLKNRIIFLFMPVWLNSCQSFQPSAELKDSNNQKIIETNLTFAQKQIDAGQPQNALQTLRPLVRSFPQNPSLLNMVGLSYLALSNAAYARNYFQQAYAIDKDPMYALNLSSALIAEGSFVEAESVLQKLLKEKSYPYSERVYHNYALLFEKRKKYRKAVSYYTKAVNENPSYYLSHLRLGKIYQLERNRTSAKLAYEKAANACSLCFEPVQEASLIYLDEGNFKKASALLQHFLANKEISSDNRSQARSLLGLAQKMNRHR